MRTPNQGPAGRRRWVPAAAVTGGVLLVGLLALALWPRTATATASFTVTPRTENGAAAAVLLADRYAALAGSGETLRAARDGVPALADVGPDELIEGTDVERAAGTATIGVAVTLPDADTAVAAANAVVDTLVAAGAEEELVDVAPGTEATAARADRRPDVPRWALVAVLAALAAGLLSATATGGRPRLEPAGGADEPAAPAPVDDLPGFRERPPGSPPASPPTAPPPVPATGATAVGSATPVPVPVPVPVRGTVPATVAGAVALVVAAVLVAATGGSGSPGGGRVAAAGAPQPIGPAPTPTAPTAPAAPVPTAAAPSSATGTTAGALALDSVPPGEDGVTTSVTFTGVVLEQRAVGLTVTYPSLSVSTDGRRALAHLRLPTFNCLTAEPPPDPLAAGCVRSLTEYADLSDPQLQVSRADGRLDLAGLFPTYTRPNGSPPVYTGRAYQLTAAVTADGPATDGGAPASGVVRIGPDAAPTSERGVNLWLAG